jgi:hypothetical protein
MQIAMIHLHLSSRGFEQDAIYSSTWCRWRLREGVLMGYTSRKFSDLTPVTVCQTPVRDTEHVSNCTLMSLLEKLILHC